MPRTKIDRDKLIRLYKEGYSISELARIFDVSRQGIYNALPDEIIKKNIKNKEEKIKKQKQELKEYLLRRAKELGINLKDYDDVEELILDTFKFLEDIELKEIDRDIYEIIGKKEGKEETYIVFTCDKEINLILEKDDCLLTDKVDLYLPRKFIKLLLKLIQKFNGKLAKEDIDDILSDEYMLDVSIINKTKGKFQLRKRNKTEHRQITIFNSTRKDIHEIVNQLAQIKKKLVKRDTQEVE